jgi:flagellar biosynthesis anti-sigma factor FlgM
MRIPSRVYQSPDQVQTERVVKSSDSKKAEPGREATQTGRRESDVKVNVSERARALADENAVDVQKVERLRSAIDSGDFQVDSRQIASRIVDGG